MTAVIVEITPRPATAGGSDAIEVVADMDAYLESAMCSCSASDNNPY